MGLLDAKVAIISGTGPGLGGAIVQAFAREGALIIASDNTKSALPAETDQIDAIVCDITDGAQCAAVIERALERHGRIDILVNDAYSGGDHSTFEAADLDNWRATAEVNYIGTLRMCQAVVPEMKAQGHGRIININTEGVEWIQTPFGAYSASKAALQNATRLMAYELGKFGIRVNGIHPGPIFTDSLRGHLQALADQSGSEYDEVYREWAETAALREITRPADIADAVVLLASDLARAITGQSVFVNSGHWFH